MKNVSVANKTKKVPNPLIINRWKNIKTSNVKSLTPKLLSQLNKVILDPILEFGKVINKTYGIYQTEWRILKILWECVTSRSSGRGGCENMIDSLGPRADYKLRDYHNHEGQERPNPLSPFSELRFWHLLFIKKTSRRWRNRNWTDIELTFVIKWRKIPW